MAPIFDILIRTYLVRRYYVLIYLVFKNAFRSTYDVCAHSKFGGSERIDHSLTTLRIVGIAYYPRLISTIAPYRFVSLL